MVCLSKKKQNGKYYYYIEERAWINGKSQRLWQKSLGREDKLREMSISLAPREMEYKTLEFGSSAALLQIARKIDLVKTIDSVAGKRRDQNLTLGEYMLINTINRCVSPASKSQLADWFSKDYISTIFPISPEILNASTYWNHFQLLDEEKLTQIEIELTRTVLEEYKLDLSCVLFDPTNFYTFISEHDNDQLAKFGHSKESRDNLRIINVSLLCTLLYGVPLFHYTYEGNVQDAKHFKGVISQITDRFQAIGSDIEEITLLFDKGNHSKEAFTEIDTIDLPFIASLRNSTQKDLFEVPTEKFTFINLSSNGKEVGYYRINRKVFEKDRNVYVILDPCKKRKDIINCENKIQIILLEIDEFLLKLNVKKWRKKEAVEKKLKEIIGKRPLSTIISVSVTGTYGKLKVTIDVKEKNKEEYLETLGRSIIFTSITSWSPAKIIQAFRDKYVVEDSFKNLKNPKFLSIRPMYHWSEKSIRAHVFSCILGLLLLSLIRLELRQEKIDLSYEKILKNLSDIQLIQIFISPKIPPIYKLTKQSGLSTDLFKKLKLKAFLPK